MNSKPQRQRVARSLFVLDVFPHISRLISSTRDVETTTAREEPPATALFIPVKGPQYLIETHVLSMCVCVLHHLLED